MESKNLVSMVLALTVGIICVGSILVPVLSDAMTTEDTFTNEGYYYMQKISASDEGTYTLGYEYDADTSALEFTYNGDAIDNSIFPNTTNSFTFATDGNWVIRAANNETVGLQGIGESFNWGGHNTRTVTAEFSSGTVTINRTYLDGDTQTVVSAAAVTNTYDELWIYSADATDYVMKKMDSSAYLVEDSVYYAYGITTVTDWRTFIVIEGTVDDFTPTIAYPPDVTTTVTNKEIVSESVSNYVGLTYLEKLTFTISDGTSTVGAAYSYFIVPAEVTAERAVHFDAAQIAMLAVLPLMMIVAVLMIAVRAVNRD